MLLDFLLEFYCPPVFVFEQTSGISGKPLLLTAKKMKIRNREIHCINRSPDKLLYCSVPEVAANTGVACHNERRWSSALTKRSDK